MEVWTKEKPKEPGRYWTRWQSDPKERHKVTVKRKGRGLIVIPEPPFEYGVRMSEIGPDELEWNRIE